jgi:hypothetical protein
MNLTQRLALLGCTLLATLAITGCVITPHSHSSQPGDLNKMSEQALATCGAGQVKEVNAKSFSCK